MEYKYKTICPVCGANTNCSGTGGGYYLYTCPNCGQFELKNPNTENNLNPNYLAPYLAYHKFSQEDLSERRYHTVRDKEWCDTWKKEFEQDNSRNGNPVHMDDQIIEAWYPKTLSEKIDQFLLYLNKSCNHLGERVKISPELLLNLLFVDRYELGFPNEPMEERPLNKRADEADYILNLLSEKSYIEKCSYSRASETPIRLAIEAYSRIDELQKNVSSSRDVLVAMKFGDDTKKLREEIRKGISMAGYHAVFIDEVQFNDLITPELLKHIRMSKFVVADLTHKNNGAYFEEGYAMGLGKTVIQLCQSGIDLHFDVAQKNTIMWKTEEDIPKLLCNRIKATID